MILMSLIFGKYKNKRRLGKGGYGQVLLVEDIEKKQYALKIISLQLLNEQPYLYDYLEGEIKCMKAMNSPYMMKLYEAWQDQKYKYMLCEYCDGGDLINLQAKQPQIVFSLEKSIQILSHVIRGLEMLHKQGYVHRDIKPQNILVKNQGGEQQYKLADFGFTKKTEDLKGTVLGTDHFMSPQIFRSDKYGFEVDMWAFGVLFFFMLNKQYPFKIHPLMTPVTKQKQLKNSAAQFSYRKAVSNTKKKLVDNCTDEVQDIFKKIFCLEADQRITFFEIRKHSLFKKHFPVVDQASKLLYSQRLQNNMLTKTMLGVSQRMMFNSKTKKQQKKVSQIIQQNNEQLQDTNSLLKSTMCYRQINKHYPRQKYLIQNKIDEYQFLYESAIEFMNSQLLSYVQKVNIGFNIVKYYVILMRVFVTVVRSTQTLQKIYSNLKWQQYCKTPQFINLVSLAQQGLQKAQLKYDFLYGQCQQIMKQLLQINPKFQTSFFPQIVQKDFEGKFKQSYRKSSNYTFKVLRSQQKQQSAHKQKRQSERSIKINYSLAVLSMCHMFNSIFQDQKNLPLIFEDYFKDKGRDIESLDFSQLREWMTCCGARKLKQIYRKVIKIYLT